MKHYDPKEHVPMKFHNLYVWFLNPLGILLSALVSVLLLLTAYNVTISPELQSQLGLDNQPVAHLWVMFAFVAATLLFAVISEVLLAKRKRLGVMILIFGYLSSIATGVSTYIGEKTTTNLVSLCIVALIGVMVCIYYWKRRRLLH